MSYRVVRYVVSSDAEVSACPAKHRESRTVSASWPGLLVKSAFFRLTIVIQSVCFQCQADPCGCRRCFRFRPMVILPLQAPTSGRVDPRSPAIDTEAWVQMYDSDYQKTAQFDGDAPMQPPSRSRVHAPSHLLGSLLHRIATLILTSLVACLSIGSEKQVIQTRQVTVYPILYSYLPTILVGVIWPVMAAICTRHRISIVSHSKAYVSPTPTPPRLSAHRQELPF